MSFRSNRSWPNSSNTTRRQNNYHIVDTNSFYVGTDEYNTTLMNYAGDIQRTPSDGAADDQFGKSVAVGCKRVVVGAPYDDDNGSNSGSAYIYTINAPGTYGVQFFTKITASDGAAGDLFGWRVAVGNGRIVVGAQLHSNQKGAVYIFDLNGTQLAKITGSDTVNLDRFGYSVAVGCGRIVVGATGDDDNGSSSGSVYIFDLNGTQLAKITDPYGAASDFFGWSVAVGSGRIVVGAPGYDRSATKTGAGTALIFDLNGNYKRHIYIRGSSFYSAFNDRFGESVAVKDGMIAVGAPGDGLVSMFDLTGNYSRFDNILNSQYGEVVAIGHGKVVIGGSTNEVHIFNDIRIPSSSEETIPTSSFTPSTGDKYGGSVAIGSGYIIVGAPLDDDNGSASGSMFAYSVLPYSVDHFLDLLDRG